MSRGRLTPQPEFAPLFHELLATRSRYEALRIGNGPLLERSLLLDELHQLRYQMSRTRSRSA